MRKHLLTIGIIGTISLPALAVDSSTLQEEINDLKAQNKLIMERLEHTAERMEKSADSANNRTRIGGYGELHYNNLSNQKSGGSDKKEIDLHRFILFLGHEFDDKLRFWSEVEIEHSKVDDSGGEVAIEQAYLEFDLNADHAVRTGIFLIPIGIMNETHEPPTFYGVERNNVEKNIIPTTWREGGISLHGSLSEGLNYDLAVHSGLQTSSSSSYKIRSGRQSVRQAPMEDPAMTAAITWTAMAGLELGAAIQHQADVTQSTDTSAGSAQLIEAHAVLQKGDFALRALYASWDLDGSGPAAIGADEQTGWYVEPSFKFNPKFGIFARHSLWDNTANSSTDSEYTQTDIGFNYWPHENVVLKVDYQDQSVPNGKDEYDGINLGMGYQF